ncbi:hypothetical protein BGW80DRAFT_1274994 [Lactifluus volemus]|nr:hypothetical protein BGW80DRAFT_1274994 [Lactifluus volemus]
MEGKRLRGAIKGPPKKKNAFEIGTWACSEEYVKDVSILDPAYERLVGPGGPAGVNKIFFGLEAGRSNAWAVLNWDSVEDHHNFQADHEAYRKFVELFKPTAKDGKPKGTIIYAYWEVDEALPCLKAPLVELTKITAKEGIAKKDIYAVLDKYIAHIRSLVDGATYGDVYEKPGQIVLVIGWKSIQASLKEKSAREELGLIGQVEVTKVLLKQIKGANVLSYGDTPQG